MVRFMRLSIGIVFVGIVGKVCVDVCPLFGILGTLYGRNGRQYTSTWSHNSKTPPLRSTSSNTYLTILAYGSGFFPMRLWHFLVHFHPLHFHFAHDLPSLCIFELIELISFCLLFASGLFLALLGLLHDYFVPDGFFHDDVVEDVAEELVLHVCVNIFKCRWLYFMISDVNNATEELILIG